MIFGDHVTSMFDVFLSYAQEDRTRAELVAKALRVRGWSVWWSDELRVGTPYRNEIQRHLQSAKCVVVLWSNASIESEWVIDEADEGKTRNVLVQGIFDSVQPPHGFRGRQWADLSKWQGDVSASTFQQLADGVAQFVGSIHLEPRSVSSRTGRSLLSAFERRSATSWKRAAWIAVALALVALTGIVASMLTSDRRMASDEARNAVGRTAFRVKLHVGDGVEPIASNLRVAGYRVDIVGTDPDQGRRADSRVMSIGSQVPPEIAAPVIRAVHRDMPWVRYVFVQRDVELRDELFLNAHDEWIEYLGLKPLSDSDFARLENPPNSPSAFHGMLEAFKR